MLWWEERLLLLLYRDLKLFHSLCSSAIFARAVFLRPLVMLERTPYSDQVELSWEEVRVLREEHGRNSGFLLGRSLQEKAVV